MSLHSEKQFSAKAVSLVTIRITDVNDNKPRFESAHERIAISEDLPIGSSITVVRAIDDDAMGLNSKLQYILEEVLLTDFELSYDIITRFLFFF